MSSTNKSLHLFTIQLLLLFAAIEASSIFKKERVKLPSYIKVCHRSDPHLNSCVRKSALELREQLHLGIPEMFIPPIEPLVIPEIKLDQDSGAIFLHSTYKNISIHGLSNFTLSELTIDPEKMKLSMSMKFARISMKAQYEMNGKIMLMPLVGSGKCRANFTDVELHMVIVGQRYKKQGRTLVKIQNIHIKYDLGKAQMHLENLFNGDNALGDRMNDFLNENWESLSEEIRPLLENAMSEVMRSSTDKLFETYSYDDLLPE